MHLNNSEFKIDDNKTKIWMVVWTYEEKVVKISFILYGF